MNKNFILGAVSGIASAMLIISLAFIIVTSGAGKGAITGVGEKDDTSSRFKMTEDGKENASSYDFERKREIIEDLISKYYYGDVDRSVLEDGMLRGMVNSLKDPYSAYYNSEEFARLVESSKGIYCGVGVLLHQNIQTMMITIISTAVDGPSYKAGVLPGDVLIAVNGESVIGQNISDVVMKTRGEEGTKVVITVTREGEVNPLEFTLYRARIENLTVTCKMLDNKVGYINISEFDDITIKQFNDAVDELEQNNAVGMIIDLRGNPGGLMKAAVETLDRIIEKGLLVYTEDKYGVCKEDYAKTDECYNKPIVVLINGNSASASEIFAGALRDYGVVTIVGTQSYGKGIVQSIIPIMDGEAALKITVSRYFTPKGVCVHGVGITPDIIAELDPELTTQPILLREYDNQLEVAVQVLLDKLNK